MQRVYGHLEGLNLVVLMYHSLYALLHTAIPSILFQELFFQTPKRISACRYKTAGGLVLSEIKSPNSTIQARVTVSIHHLYRGVDESTHSVKTLLISLGSVELSSRLVPFPP